MRSALGKGLNALISEDMVASVGAPASALSQSQVAIASIRANPKQPRKIFAEQALNELSDSIKEHGVLQPILVSAQGDGTYEIIAGERRWRAAQRAGLTEIPVVLKSGSETEKFAIALIENIQRADLNAIELAKGYKRLQDEFTMTQEAIAKAVGKDRAVVANALRLLSLAPEIQSAVEAGKLSAAHARTPSSKRCVTRSKRRCASTSAPTVTTSNPPKSLASKKSYDML
jgi:ParB family chromosome partitioning protein